MITLMLLGVLTMSPCQLDHRAEVDYCKAAKIADFADCVSWFGWEKDAEIPGFEEDYRDCAAGVPIALRECLATEHQLGCPYDGAASIAAANRRNPEARSMELEARRLRVQRLQALGRAHRRR